MLGPIDYVVVGFEGNAFDGSILEELSKAVKNGTVRVIDLLFIIKDEDGSVLEGEFEDQSDDIHDMLNAIKYDEREGLPLLTDDDIAKIGEQMPLNTAAGVLVLEHVWAKGLKKALLDAGGFLIADGRIHPEAIEAAMKELETTEAK
jgi:hypothetical protein